MALAAQRINLDVIGSDEVDVPELHTTSGLNFLNLQNKKSLSGNLLKKTWNLVIFYARLIWYTSTTKRRILHILWNNKVEFLDRTLLMLYYKGLGKKVVLTAHNVNARKRDANDSALNRFTLKVQYRLAHHIFVHTEKMKRELVDEYGVAERAITVIPFGINTCVPNTSLTPAEAKKQLGIKEGERTILFFGRIRPYKGLNYLVAAFQQISAIRSGYRLIIVGEPNKYAEEYVEDIRHAISGDVDRGAIIEKMGFVPDEDTELYFKAADVVALPYTAIFQSGVLFLAYSFGLPVIATRVGSFVEDIIEGETGVLCDPCVSADLVRAIETYFDSDLFRDLENRRQSIREYASERHSWTVVGEITRNVYADMLGREAS
jgi:glycosyltransferase involved in cell wall biosynthesis